MSVSRAPLLCRPAHYRRGRRRECEYRSTGLPRHNRRLHHSLLVLDPLILVLVVKIVLTLTRRDGAGRARTRTTKAGRARKGRGGPPTAAAAEWRA